MYILGISSYYHDSAASLISNGNLLYACEEERFTRKKHDNAFPLQAIKFCLKEAKITANQLTYIAYYEKPLLKFERIIENFVDTYPHSLKPFLKGLPEWLTYKIKIEKKIRQELRYHGKIVFIPHHLSHASSAYFQSPFNSAAILTIDGIGEYMTTGLWSGEKNNIKALGHLNFPNSLGLLYSTFTAFLGFKTNEDEYKVMGLAAYGKPTYLDKIRSVIHVEADGSFEMDMRYFSFREEFTMWSKPFESLFGQPRMPSEKITSSHKNLAASIQIFYEETLFKILNHLHGLTRSSNLCLGGGVALNALANGKIYNRTPFKKLYVFGPAGDSGASTGAALFVYHQLLKKLKLNPSRTLLLGSTYSDSEIEPILKQNKLKYERLKNNSLLVDTVARLLATGKIIGWFQGRMEFGPRALGSRSILSKTNPRSMKERVNHIKIREQFRPFAGSILQEKIHEYFNVPEKKHSSPYMIFCFTVKPKKAAALSAIVHQDGTCRIQTVNNQNGLYYELIKKYYSLTKIPCILNTSFNLKGEPIVENPSQAVNDFLNTSLDYLAIGNFLVTKADHRL